MKLAFVSALAFAATQGVNAQMTAPDWAQEQNNATVQTLAEGLQDGQNFVVSESDRVIVYNVIEKNTINQESEYFVSVVGITKSACDAGVTEVVIPFSVMNGTVTAKVVKIETFDVIDDAADPAKLETKVTGVSLAGITKLTVGISGTADHLYPVENTTTITTIEDGAFANLTGLTEIITYIEEPATMTKSAFPSTLYSKAKLSVAPSDLGTIAGKFATAPGWENFQRIYTVGDIYAFGDFNADGLINTLDTSDFAVYSKKRGKNYTEPYNEHSVDFDGSGKWSTLDLSLFRTWQKKRFRKI